MKNTGVENAGLENVGPNRGGERRDWKTRDQISRVENARPPSTERETDKYKLKGTLYDMYIILLI